MINLRERIFIVACFFAYERIFGCCLCGKERKTIISFKYIDINEKAIRPYVTQSASFYQSTIVNCQKPTNTEDNN